MAGRLLDYIRNYDLNNYALGVSVSVSQRPYLDTENSVVAYPYLTSFEYSGFTDDWLLLTDGELGVRRVTQNDFEYGLLGRIQTLGFGSETPPPLIGMEPRQWTIETGPYVGYRGWPLHLNLKAFKEISGRHGGWTSEFRVTLPKKQSWGYVVPGVQLSYTDNAYTDYYYSVSDVEAAPGRPAYDAGSSQSISALLRFGVQISDHWLVTGKVSYELLDDEVTNSSIVEQDSLWSGTLGIAYNADIFQRRDYGPDTHRLPRFEFRVGLFQDSIETEITRDDENGIPGEPIDLEDRLGLSDKDSVLQFDAIYRFSPWHRIEAGYFDLTRDSSLTLQNDLIVGEEEFPAGTEIDFRSDLRVFRAGYAFSLMNDAQKELGVVAGAHVSRFETEINAPDTNQREFSSATTPLPFVGAHGSVSLGDKTALAMQVQIFRMEFDNFAGRMNFVNLTLQHSLWQRTSVGVGFNYYSLKLDSDLPAINGTVDITHKGPYIFLGMHF